MKTLSIGGEKFKVSYEDIEDFGQTHFDKKLIVIRKGLSKEDSKRTLFHEAIHAALFMSGISFTFEGGQEEAVVRALDNIFYPAAKKILTEKN